MTGNIMLTVQIWIFSFELHDGFSCFVISVLNQKMWDFQTVAHKPYVTHYN
jgi:hypothetical protein